MAYEVSSGLRRIARELRDSTTGHRGGAAHGLRARGEDARAELARLWAQMEDIVEHRLGPAARDASHDMREYLEEGRDVAVDAAWRVREAARAHPLMAVGIAVVATWVVASLVRGRR